jgi:hypothetical protein
MKAPIVYIVMDVLSIIIEVIGGLIMLNLYGDEYKTEYVGRDGSMKEVSIADQRASFLFGQVLNLILALFFNGLIYSKLRQYKEFAERNHFP